MNEYFTGNCRLGTYFPEVKIISPIVFHDERGLFLEAFNTREYEKIIGRKLNFVQDNYSQSFHNVLRGLHYQVTNPQAKLIRVTEGEIFDVIVDLRLDSPTFGEWAAHLLSTKKNECIWIPEGFAHGFYVLSEKASVYYKTTSYWDKSGERTLIWNDSTLNIPWPTCGQPILSDKDRRGELLANVEKIVI